MLDKVQNIPNVFFLLIIRLNHESLEMFIDNFINFLYMKSNRPKFSDNPLSGSTTLDLPSNLLQHRKSTIRQFRSRYAAGTRNVSPKQFATQVAFFAKPKQNLFIQERIQHNKKSALYKRLSHIQVQNKELSGISFSKLLSRMVIMDQKLDSSAKYNKEYFHQSKIRGIPNYQTIKSKIYEIQCPQQERRSTAKSYSIQKLAEPSAKLFRKYYMPNGDKFNTSHTSNFSTIECDDKYIYKNGKKAQCKRIHNFYTSQNFKNGFEKQLRKTHDGFFNTSIQKTSQTMTLSNSRNRY